MSRDGTDASSHDTLLRVFLSDNIMAPYCGFKLIQTHFRSISGISLAVSFLSLRNKFLPPVLLSCRSAKEKLTLSRFGLLTVEILPLNWLLKVVKELLFRLRTDPRTSHASQ